MEGEKKAYPRILFTAPKSGCGKTLITCGFLEILRRKGLSAASFKCGPDYIDPMFHKRALGADAGNLDSYFTGPDLLRYLFQCRAKGKDISVLEGAMGYYDGIGGQSEQGSAYEIAKITGTPVVLIVDAKGASVSLAAVIRGMADYRKDSNISGVLLNRVSPSYYERLQRVMEEETGLPVLGYVPEHTDFSLPSRHLGLMEPEKLPRVQDWVKRIADQMEKTVAADKLLELAKQAVFQEEAKTPVLPGPKLPVRLAVARDEAFSFAYEENYELLERMGAKLVFFSPLHDAKLPEAVDGLILGGGYPESYVRELEKGPVRQELRKACGLGMPCLAECGGFLYLQQELEGDSGGKESRAAEDQNPEKTEQIAQTGRMAGVLSGRGFRTEKLQRFGYVECENRRAGLWGRRGQKLRGHEFHYWDSTKPGEDVIARKPFGGREVSCMVHTHTMAAGFPHFYYYSNPEILYQFLLCCHKYQTEVKARNRWDGIAKPIGSLGWLETQSIRMLKVFRSPTAWDISKRALVIFCGDHGVVEEGVTQTGREVTQIVCENFARGCSTVNLMAKAARLTVYTVDIGMDTKRYPQKQLVPGAVIDRKIARGCQNIAREAAMTLAQCTKALQIGIETARELKQAGYSFLATGEMGIGNTTPTSALAAVFLNRRPEETVGKGAGLSREGMEKKRRAVAAAVLRVKEKNLTEPKEVLAELGGYEIAGMAGVFLGGAAYEIPVIIDGAISAIAALTAFRIDSRVKDIAIPSHQSAENTGKWALEELGLEPAIHAGMCLGEGSGAAAVVPLLDMAMEVYQHMGTFTEYAIEPYTRFTDLENT